MKNVTIALDDETHRLARIRAAQLQTSLSALVKDYLTGLVAAGDSTPSRVTDQHAKYIPAMHADGPPCTVDKERVYTPDGKPRRPGALRAQGGDVDLPDTPDWLVEITGHWDEGDFDPLP